MKNTSLDAYRGIQKSRAPLLREVVYNYIYDHPGCTQIDISAKYGESARKRVSELVGPNVGDIKEMDVPHMDSTTGRKYTRYRVRGAEWVSRKPISGGCERWSRGTKGMGSATKSKRYTCSTSQTAGASIVACECQQRREETQSIAVSSVGTEHEKSTTRSIARA